MAKLKSTPKPVPASQFHAWIAWWDENNALNSLVKNTQSLNSISPVWYELNSEGKLQATNHKTKTAITAAAKQANIKIIPVIANNFDPVRVSKVINNSDTSRLFIEELANLATTENYQGFDIDWEEINPADQQSFTLFIQKAAELLHTYNLTLTVSVHPQTGQTSDREVAKAYKLAGLSQTADTIKIMAYDFHNPNSNPGAITPFIELKQVLKFSTSIIPTEKIILGLPTYGYDWPANGQKGSAVSFLQAQEIIKKYNGQVTRDTNSDSLVGNYNFAENSHQVWFEDAQTINKMVEIARSYGVYQFSFWRLGVEDPEVWGKIKGTF